jgi:putative ABC transport system permease protein
MIKNYFKLALRNIARKKLYTVINLIGLSIASAFCVLIYLYVQHEQSFDRFHKNVNQLYRLEFSDFWNNTKEEKKSSFFSFLMKNSEQHNMIQTPAILALELKKDFPEIEHAIRIHPGYEEIVRVNNQSFKEEKNIAYVDSDFFNVFSFPLKEGNASDVLAGHNQIVLSETAALKYFGQANPIGKTILLPNEDSTLFTVSGIAKDFPINSSLRYDLIMPRTSTPDYNGDIQRGINTFSDPLILQIKKGTNIQFFEQKLNAFGKRYFVPTLKQWAEEDHNLKPENFHIYLRPFAEAHYNASTGWDHYTDLQNIYQLCCLAVIILVIACLNYILLTLTSTVSRSQEVGIRKTIGAARKHVILQFYIETQLLAFFAAIGGFVLAVGCLPLFNSLTGSTLNLSFFSFADVASMLFVLAITLGVIAGVYPALVMSGLKPLNMMRKFSAYKLNPFLSKFLATTQFSVCIVLIISTLVISKQMEYINQKDLGFDKEQVLTISNPYWFTDPEKSMLLKDRLAHFASTEPSIENFSSSFLGYNNTNAYNIRGETVMLQAFDVDFNYFSFFKIPIIKGREFSSAIPEDSSEIKLSEGRKGNAARQAVVVNETLYNILGRPPLNTMNDELGGRIIGVCKDYYPDDLTKKVSPAYHKIQKKYIGFFSFRIKAGQNIPVVVNRIKSNWNKLTGDEPFSYTFLDETLAKNYDAYIRWMRTVTVSSIIAIVIACMGLFGLSGLSAISRIKEIGIRKVLGASVKDLFLLLNKGTLIMAVISFFIAVPVAVFLCNAWLQNFAYRIDIGWSLFVIAGIIGAVTALIAVSYHTIKTALANPVKSLRTA